jgi:hypothetical protein
MLVFISAKPSVTRARGAVDQRLVKPGSLCGFAVVYLLRAFRVACRTPRRRDQRLSGGRAWVAFATCPKRLMQASAFGPRLTLPVSRLRLMNPPMVLKAKCCHDPCCGCLSPPASHGGLQVGKRGISLAQLCPLRHDAGGTIYPGANGNRLGRARSFPGAT